MTQAANRLTALSPYIYGTTRLGDESLPLEDRITIAQEAMKTGAWFHVSDQYGSALSVLTQAYNNNRDAIPRSIYKIEAKRIEDMRGVIHNNIDPLGLAAMDIGQLCLRDRQPEDFCPGSKGFTEYQNIRREGLVKQYVLEVFPWTAPIALEAIQQGCMDELIDGLIFYFNPLQRFTSNALWDLIQEKQLPVIAMRTVCGANILSLRDVPGVAWKDYLQTRAADIAPIFERSGIASWTEFCMRFVHSTPTVCASVGATNKIENLQTFLNVSHSLPPLPTDIVEEISQLQGLWAETIDAHAEAWSM